MRQPRPTQVELIETGDRHAIIDNTGGYPGSNQCRAKDVLEMIKALAVRATHGMPGEDWKPALKTDCWMITYASGDFEVVTLGNAFSGLCRFPGKPVSYVAPMKLVWR
jgi:hypothetical protein